MSTDATAQMSETQQLVSPPDLHLSLEPLNCSKRQMMKMSGEDEGIEASRDDDDDGTNR